MVVPFGVGPVIASGLSAVVVGLAGGLMSRRWGIPPLITMIVGYTPMLPGLMLYRGMYASLNEQMITGFTNMAMALAISGALAAGVVLGERVARRLRRPQYFRPYTAFKRIGRFSFHKATHLARKARASRACRCPRLPARQSPGVTTKLGPKPPQQHPRHEAQNHAPHTRSAADLWPEDSQWRRSRSSARRPPIPCRAPKRFVPRNRSSRAPNPDPSGLNAAGSVQYLL